MEVHTSKNNELDWVINTAESTDNLHFKTYDEWRREHQDRISMEEEVAKITSIGKQIGWSRWRLMKRVMCMPFHIFVALRRLTNGEFASNTPEGKKMMYKFLLRHPQYTVKPR